MNLSKSKLTKEARPYRVCCTMQIIMRFFYILILYLAVPFILLRLWLRSKNFKAYKDRWAERFGFSDIPSLQHVIWIHAVSFGEAAAAEGLIHSLKQRHPTYSLVVTTMTPTGSAHVTKVFEQQVHHVYLPYDLPFAVKRFLDKIQPKLGILMETELWPNLLHACSKRKIPILLANARLSSRSCRGYRYIAPLARQMLNQVTQIAAQT